MIKLRRPNPDGLDPVFEAYHLLKKYFDAAEVEEEEVQYEDGAPAGTAEFLVLPGLQVAFLADDINPLVELEGWLTQQLKQRMEEGDE